MPDCVTLSAIITESGGGRDGTTVGFMFLGSDLLAYIVLAVGGGLVAGSGMALVRPPAEETGRAPVARTAAMIAVGAFASLWAVATLLSR